MYAFKIYFKAPVLYEEAMLLQESLVAARIADSIPDIVLFLEHLPIITLGVRAKEANVLLSPEELSGRNIRMVKTSRGGDVTWHGPGQIIMYPIIKLGDKNEDAHGYLHNLEEIALRTAGDFGVSAFRRKGMTGAWTSAGKLAAIGIRLKRWVTFHGMSFNVNSEMKEFDTIVPCGLKGECVVSLHDLLGKDCPAIKTVREHMCVHFSEVCQRKLKVFNIDEHPHTEIARIMASYIDGINKNGRLKPDGCP